MLRLVKKLHQRLPMRGRTIYQSVIKDYPPGAAASL